MAETPTTAPARGPATLFRDVRVFDSERGVLTPPAAVLVEGPTIARVAPTLPAPDPARPATVVDGGGRVLLPGLIDAHWHAMFAAVPFQEAVAGDVGYLTLIAAREAGATLRRGFTTVRDAGGPAFALKRAIDEGVVPGPRIYPSGAILSQTGGHGDFRLPYEVPRSPRRAAQPLASRSARPPSPMAPDEVRRRTGSSCARGPARSS